MIFSYTHVHKPFYIVKLNFGVAIFNLRVAVNTKFTRQDVVNYTIKDFIVDVWLYWPMSSDIDRGHRKWYWPIIYIYMYCLRILYLIIPIGNVSLQYLILLILPRRAISYSADTFSRRYRKRSNVTWCTFSQLKRRKSLLQNSNQRLRNIWHGGKISFAEINYH